MFSAAAHRCLCCNISEIICILAAMRNKKCLLFFFFGMILCFSVAAHTRNGSLATEQGGTICERTSEIDLQRIVAVEGLLQPCVKVTESNSPLFRGLKNGNKYPALSISGNSAIAFILFQRSYSRLRSERGSATPFYIAYHRLII